MTSATATTAAARPCPPRPPGATMMKQRDVERWKRAYRRTTSYRTRHSTVGAAEFFSCGGGGDGAEDSGSGGWTTDGAGPPDRRRPVDWRTLPDRLKRLRDHLVDAEADGSNGGCDNGTGGGDCSPSLQRPSMSIDGDGDGDDDHTNPFRSRRAAALTAAVFGMAGPDLLPAFRQLFAAALASRQARWERSSGTAHEGGVGEEEDGDGDGDGDGDPMEEDCSDGGIGGGGGEDRGDGGGEGGGVGFDEAEVYASLRTLGWTQTKLARPMGEALHSTILTAVGRLVGGEFEDGSMLDLVSSWRDAVVAPWVRDVVGPESYDRDEWAAKLAYATAECFCDVRIGEIFDVVADYPDSLPAVTELRDALDRTGMHPRLASELRSSLSRRLIHPGANTSQIINVYINTIKVLREIDPSDGLLDAVAEPVRSYLRGRADTVRCIVTSLTDEEAGGDLYDELRRQDARPLEQARLDSDDEGDAPDYDWHPAPSFFRRGGIEVGAAAPQQLAAQGLVTGGDILSMLVGIYGSKELFVNEYRVMLADKLLANLDFDTDREVHNLELLKLRFGELSMRQCEIMIKDIDDSKRINTNIHSTLRSKGDAERRRRRREGRGSAPMEEDGDEGDNNGDDDDDDGGPVVDAAIVSHIFWPALQKEQLKNHPRIQAELDRFSGEYATYKNPRRLIWLGQLGTVQVELEVVDESGGGRSSHAQEFTCSPLQATLISHFEDRDQWTASDLANETGVAEDVVRKKMGYWINNRVVQVGASGLYELTSVDDLAEGSEHGSGVGSGMYDDEEDGEGQAVSVGAQEAEEMQVYESYIVGMLTNLGQLPLDRIHNNLKMFASGSDHKYDKTPRQLSAFLQKLCREEKLECGADGMYKLMKK